VKSSFYVGDQIDTYNVYISRTDSSFYEGILYIKYNSMKNTIMISQKGHAGCPMFTGELNDQSIRLMRAMAKAVDELEKIAKIPAKAW
jgi:hypothetical protein